jgi:type I restriction enzyme S subunit
MTQVRIADITDIVMGQSPPGESYNETGVGLPFFQGKAEFGETSPTAKKWCTDPRRIAERGDILMSVRAPVGPTNIAGEQCCIGRGLAAIRARASVTQDFLRYFFRHAEPILAHQGQGSTFTAIGRAEIAALTLRLPSLEEQHRLVDLLSRAEGIVRLRREAKRKTAELVPALFLDMFGDPASNPNGWPVVPFADVIGFTRYGPRFPNREYSETLKGGRVLRTTDIKSDGTISADEAPILPMTDEEIGKYALNPNTIVVTRTGATIGKVALYEHSEEPAVAGAYLIEVRLGERVLPQYILNLLMSQYGQQRLTSGARAVAQPNLNVPTISAIPVPIPPSDLQRQFASKVEAVRAIASQQAAALATAQATFDALLHQSFRR